MEGWQVTAQTAKDFSEILDTVQERMVHLRSDSRPTEDAIFTLATDMETIAVQLQQVLNHIHETTTDISELED